MFVGFGQGDDGDGVLCWTVCGRDAAVLVDRASRTERPFIVFGLVCRAAPVVLRPESIVQHVRVGFFVLCWRFVDWPDVFFDGSKKRPGTAAAAKDDGCKKETVKEPLFQKNKQIQRSRSSKLLFIFLLVLYYLHILDLHETLAVHGARPRRSITALLLGGCDGCVDPATMHHRDRPSWLFFHRGDVVRGLRE